MASVRKTHNWMNFDSQRDDVDDDNDEATRWRGQKMHKDGKSDKNNCCNQNLLEMLFGKKAFF